MFIRFEKEDQETYSSDKLCMWLRRRNFVSVLDLAPQLEIHGSNHQASTNDMFFETELQNCKPQVLTQCNTCDFRSRR